MRVHCVLSLIAMTVLASCAEAPPTVAAPSDRIGRVLQLVEQEKTASSFARGIASALRDAAVRASVRDAMRASPFNEHKLVLQDFLATDAGAPLLQGLAAELHASPAEIRTRLASLPKLDFYAPVAAHRKAWLGTDDILVGAAFKHTGEATLTLFDTRGASRELSRTGTPPTTPLLILHPAQSKVLRSTQWQKPRKAGATLMMDGDCSDQSIETCDSGGGGGSGGYAVTHGLYLAGFNPQDNDGWFDGDVEVLFDIDENTTGSRSAYFQRNVPAWEQHDELILVFGGSCVPETPPRFKVRITEIDDGWWWDWWGEHSFPEHELGSWQQFYLDGDLKMWALFICR